MNFFDHQDRARATTRKLVLLFAGAILALVLATVLLIVFVLSMGQQQTAAPGEGFAIDWTLFSSELFLYTSLGVLAVVGLGSMFRMAQLRGGGKVVAEALGGRLLNLNTRDADERKILNVVEEMAIASGLPVPPVYLLEDPAINAFAAGYRKEDAVIGITRGCIQLLNRDELQGVIAHEFSHIFNGDMRLNIRLIGWLYGILVIGMIGYFMLRSGRYGMMASRSRNNKGGGLVFIAIGLVVIGYGGTFFGNLIKAAVSRQREFLADASAVQFTRNPEGITGALKKIAASSEGTLLQTTDASEVSHMLFGQGIKAGFTGLFATHPPLKTRIKRLQPNWDGKLEAATPRRPLPEAAGQAGEAAGPRAPEAALRGVLGTAALAEAIVASVGAPDENSVARARARLAALPQNLHDEAHNTLGAILLVHALLMQDSAKELHEAQVAQLAGRLSAESLARLHELVVQLGELPREEYLVLLELCLPALKQLSLPQCRDFLEDLKTLARADQHLSLFEWCVYSTVRQHLIPRRPARFQKDLAQCGDDVAVLLSALVRAGHDDAAETAAAFAAAVEALGMAEAPQLRQEGTEPVALERALSRLLSLKPLQKPRLLKALVVASCHDGRLLPQERELLRAVASLLDCPLPPLPDLG